MSASGAYTGKSLSPLPHESAFSLVARIVWLNQFSGKGFQRLAELSERAYRRVVLLPDSANLERIFSLMEWEQGGTTSEHSCREEWVHPFFFSSSLRICVECIGNMYHGVWHQYLGLDACPIHGRPLRDTCPTCSQQLGLCALSTAAVHAFSCPHCGNSLSQKPVTIAGHVRFREQRSRLEGAFSPCRRQLRRQHAVLVALQRQHEKFPFESINRWWPAGLAGWQIVSDIVNAYRRNDDVQSELTWLVWPVLRRNLLRRGEWSLIYSETLWTIRNWLMRQYPQCVTSGARPRLFDSAGVLRQTVWPPEVLAYMLLRRAVEGASSWGLQADNVGVREVDEYALMGKTWFKTLGGWSLQAESVQAMVFGRFAAYYWWAKQGCQGRPRVEDIDQVVACWRITRNWEPSIAAVVFPSVENMPLGRLSPSPLRLTDAMELLRRDALFERRLSGSVKLARAGIAKS